MFSNKKHLSLNEALKRGVDDVALMMNTELKKHEKKTSAPSDSSAEIDLDKIMTLDLDILTNEQHQQKKNKNLVIMMLSNH